MFLSVFWGRVLNAKGSGIGNAKGSGIGFAGTGGHVPGYRGNVYFRPSEGMLLIAYPWAGYAPYSIPLGLVSFPKAL